MRHFVLGAVLVRVGQVCHLQEGYDLNAELGTVALNGVLGVVGSVEVDALGVLAGAGVVAADDEVGGAVVLADDGVPDGLAGASHTHGERQQGQYGHAVGVARHQGLVDAHAGKVVDVAGLGQPHDGVDQHVGLAGAGGAHRQLAVGAVHGVARLEGDDLLPAQLVEVQPQLGWRVAQTDVVVVLQPVNRLDPPAHVEGLGGVVEVGDGRMRLIAIGAEDRLGLPLLVRPVHVLDGDDGEIAVVSEVAQGHTCAGLDAGLVDCLLRDVEGDGDGEEVAVGETVVGHDALVVLLVHEAWPVLSA